VQVALCAWGEGGEVAWQALYVVHMLGNRKLLSQLDGFDVVGKVGGLCCLSGRVCVWGGGGGH